MDENDNVDYAIKCCDIFTLSSSSWMECSDSYRSDSNGRPVILIGPLGIKSTVNLNCATNSPEIKTIKPRVKNHIGFLSNLSMSVM